MPAHELPIVLDQQVDFFGMVLDELVQAWAGRR